VGIKPLGPDVSLTALTAICKIASLKLIPEGLIIMFNLFYALISFDGNLLKIDRKRTSFAAKLLKCEICARIICNNIRKALVNIDPKSPERFPHIINKH
jgi:hypothetical protein